MANEVIIDSIVDPSSTEVYFIVTQWAGRNFLYSGSVPDRDKRVAECVTGNYQERFGSIRGWLAKIKTRELQRLEKIQELQDQLTSESIRRNELVKKIDKSKEFK